MSTLALEPLYALESNMQTRVPEEINLGTSTRMSIRGQSVLDRHPDITPKIYGRKDRESTHKTAHEEQHNTLVFRDAAPSRDYFLSLQEWEGIVIRVDEDSFQARLIDLTQDNADEEAEFSLDDVSDEDRKLVAIGAIFYWSIGYKITKGQRSRTSSIRFRRLPAWSEEEIETARRKAEAMQMAISWE